MLAKLTIFLTLWIEPNFAVLLCVLFLLYLALIDLALSKKKMKEEKRRKKMRPIKTESDDGCESQTPVASLSTSITDSTPALLQSVKEE